MKNLPDFELERQAWAKGYELMIGVDEVGRGALAGPVVAGAVAFPQAKKGSSFLIDDSKRLTAKRREELAKVIKKNALWAVGLGSVATINKRGIVKATEKAMRQAIKKIRDSSTNARNYVLVDAFHVKYVAGVGLRNQKAIIKGDQKVISIAAASIIAKVYRDKLMTRLGGKYGWRKNKGYGTAKHLEAIRMNGLTRFHRREFVKNYLV